MEKESDPPLGGNEFKEILTQNDEDEARIMNELLRDFQSEQPKIDVSMKNLLSVLMGKSSLPPAILPNNTATAASPGAAQSATAAVTNISNEYLMSYAKLFLTVLQSLPMLTVDEFCRTYPQKESQSAINRIEEVCAYKALYALHSYTIQNKGELTRVTQIHFSATLSKLSLCAQYLEIKAGSSSTQSKISKVFGKKFFITSRCLNRLRLAMKEKVLGDDNKKGFTIFRGMAVEEIDWFVDAYEKSIFQPGIHLRTYAVSYFD